MSSIARRQALESDLALLETRFQDTLVAALRRCADGTWGLFGQNDSGYESHFGKAAARLVSKDAEELLGMIAEIAALRERLGYVEQNALCRRFIAYRAMRASNDLGEPKLAASFLAEISSQ